MHFNSYRTGWWLDYNTDPQLTHEENGCVSLFEKVESVVWNSSAWTTWPGNYTCAGSGALRCVDMSPGWFTAVHEADPNHTESTLALISLQTRPACPVPLFFLIPSHYLHTVYLVIISIRVRVIHRLTVAVVKNPSNTGGDHVTLSVWLESVCTVKPSFKLRSNEEQYLYVHII